MENKKNIILIVDDDSNLRRTLGDVLTLKGFVPLTAEDGNQAIEFVQREDQVVVALVDLRLEGMSGLKLLKYIKTTSPDTECILFTGYASQESVIEAINLGAFSYIQKPFDMELLLVTIQRAVEKNNAQISLRENEKRFRSLYENATLGIYRSTPDGRLLMANPALVQMLGYDSFEELAERNLGKAVYIHAYSRAQFVQQLEREDVIRAYQVGLQRKDGESIFVSESARVIRDNSGRVLYYEGTIEDITERSHAELALKASEARYRTLAENMSDTVWLMDMNVKTTYISPSVTRLRGYTLEELNALPYEQQMPPESYYRNMQLLAETLSPENLQNPNQPISRTVELEFYRKDGSSFWSENTFTLIRNADGNPIGILGSGRDITARKRAEEETGRRVNELEALYESGLEISGLLEPKKIGQKIIDTFTKRMKWHHASARLYHPETNQIELLALSVPGVPQEQAAEQAARLQAMIQTPNQGLAGWVIKHGESIRTGDILSDPRYIQTYPDMRSGLFVPVKIGWVTIGCLGVESEQPNAFNEKDERFLITAAAQAGVAFENARLFQSAQQELKERQRAEAALRDLNLKLEQRVQERTAELQTAYVELEHASRLKDEFLASMSHELRTPLTGILNISEALKDQIYGSLNEKQTKSLSLIEESGQHLLGLINDILEVSKLDAGQMELQVELFGVSEVCQRSLQLVRAIAEKKRQTISFSIEPPFAEINADPLRLNQILVNLLSNACKFTPEQGQVGLEVCGDSETQSLNFTVWDSGIGIATEDMPKLFKAFQQIDSSLARQHAGTGLGLALVQRLVDLHGGSVRVKSTPGKGSRFTVSLPWYGQKQLIEAPAVSEYENAGIDFGKEGENHPYNLLTETGQPSSQTVLAPLILFVDDNETNSMVYGDFLLSRGYRLEMASNGLEALRRAQEIEPDLVIMDIQMPGMDGLEVIRRLRSQTDPQIATSIILALTALAMPGDRERCLEAGADEYLSRPVSLKKLDQVIQEQLAQRKRRS